MSTIHNLPELLASNPHADRIFAAWRSSGQLVMPPEMLPWAAAQFGDTEGVEQQQVIRVRNRWTFEEALFNPLRARRPLDREDGTTEALIAQRLAASDLFAAPLQATPADTFGRIRGRFCMTASNIAKFDGWHGLVIFDEPHPLRFTPAHVADYLDVAARWLAAAHAVDEQARFPLIIWNCLPRAGASLVHGHLQMALSHTPFSRIELLCRAAVAYSTAQQQRGCACYFDDLLAAYAELDLLCYERQDVRAAAALTPLRNRELLFVAPVLGEALAVGLATLLHRLREREQVRAFNACVYLPPLGSPEPAWAGFPTLARVVDRGDPLSAASDIGAVELFASSVVSADPFALARTLVGTDR